MHSLDRPWLRRLRRAEHTCLSLVCFPYAGGGIGAYSSWIQELSSRIEVWFADLPGRGGRILESPAAAFPEIVASVSRAIGQSLDGEFVFFGHSLGALLSFEVARHLRARGKTLPVHLLVSAAQAPQIPWKYPETYNLPEDEFLRELNRRYQGIPQAIAAEPEVLRLLLPALRADVELVETYRYTGDAPLPCPITAFGGSADTMVSREALAAWRLQTAAGFRLGILPGNHFLLQTARARLLEEVRIELEGILQATTVTS